MRSKGTQGTGDIHSNRCVARDVQSMLPSGRRRTKNGDSGYQPDSMGYRVQCRGHCHEVPCRRHDVEDCTPCTPTGESPVRWAGLGFCSLGLCSLGWAGLGWAWLGFCSLAPLRDLFFRVRTGLTQHDKNSLV